MDPLEKLPVELWLDNVLPCLDASDLLQLSAVNKDFHKLLQDDTFWKRKLEEDFNFTPKVTARTSGWRFIYMGMRNPRVYVWGERTAGRLGLTRFPKSTTGDISSPVQLRIPGARIVNLVAGGMSFHALDSDGNVHVWGTLAGDQIDHNSSSGFSEPGKIAPNPTKLAMPARTKSISCGRLHSATLDVNNNIWNFMCWGRPFRLITPMLDCSSPETTPSQLECGWSFTSTLTKSGDVLVWYPYGERLGRVIMERTLEFDREGDKRAISEAGVIPCCVWDLPMGPVRLPPLPLQKLPRFSGSAEDRRSSDDTPHLIQIAALDNYLIGLTNDGHVLKFGWLVDEATTTTGRWEYLPNFSELEKVRSHPTVMQSEDGDTIHVPDTMQITHISAHFNKFIAYSSGPNSIVLMGADNTTHDSTPEMIPALQNRDVISVILGDYHNGALTADGELFMWGSYSRGALGLGDPAILPAGSPGGFATEEERISVLQGSRRVRTPPAVLQPSKVTFGHGKKYCFAACAAGWHTAALIIDLEETEGSEDSHSDVEEEIRNTYPDYGIPQPGATPPILPVRGTGAGIFRIGFAGRGRGLHQGILLGTGTGNHNQGGEIARGRSQPYFRVGFAGRGRGFGPGGGM